VYLLKQRDPGEKKHNDITITTKKKKILQEKAVEATKQEKERKE
jgi:hypothetical protein